MYKSEFLRYEGIIHFIKVMKVRLIFFFLNLILYISRMNLDDINNTIVFNKL